MDLDEQENWINLTPEAGYKLLVRWMFTVRCLFSTEGDVDDSLSLFFAPEEIAAGEEVEPDGGWPYRFIEAGEGLVVWLHSCGINPAPFYELTIAMNRALADDITAEILESLNDPFDRARQCELLAGVYAKVESIPPTVTTRRSRNEERDKYIYEQRAQDEPIPYSAILSKIKTTPGWARLGSDQAARQAADRYAERNGLPKVPREQ